MKYITFLFLDLVRAFTFLPGLKLFLSILFYGKSRIKIPGVLSPIFLRPGSTDFAIFMQIFVGKSYEIPFPANSKIIIDAGANIGFFSVLLKNKFPDAQIITIEPDEENFELLKKNMSSYSKVCFENAGLWNKQTNLKIKDKFDQGKWALVVEETTEETDLKAISINDLILKDQISRIDVLKIDIETSEKFVFEDNYSKWLPKVKMLVIEFHDWIEEGTAQPVFNAIQKCFKKYSYLVKGENSIFINHDID